MILSKSADYALRASIHLARNRSSRYIPLNEIAAAMRTPPFLLGRIMQRLVKGDIVISMKGHHGGFRIIREPKNITAAEIVRQVDGRFQMFDCSGIAACGLSGECTMLDMFERAEAALDSVLQTFTLEDLAHTRSAGMNGGNSNLLMGGYIEEVR